MTEAPPRRIADPHTGMTYAEIVDRVAGKGARVWDVHMRARELEVEGRDVILLSVGDPDFDTPAPIIEAAIEALWAGRTHYTSFTGTPELRAAIAARHTRMTGRSTDPEHVVVMSGAQCCLYAAIMCLAQAGDEVIVPEPMYATYEGVIGASGARLVEVPRSPARGFAVDVAAIERAITPHTRVILLNSPHNPSGALVSYDEMARLAALCHRHHLWLVSDEVYWTLVYEGTHVSAGAFADIADRTVVVDSLSKSHAMTGWRLGWMVVPGEMPHHLTNLGQCLLFGVPPFIQDAGVLALEREQALPELATMRAAFRRRRDLVVDRIDAIEGLACVHPAAGMFMMLDVRESGLDATEFAFRLVEAEGVSLLPCDGFGPSGAGFLRLSLTAPIEQLEEACVRLERFVRGLNR